MSKLRDISALIRVEVGKELGAGRVYTGEFAAAFVTRHGELVEEYYHAMAVETVKRIVRDCCKDAADTLTAPLFPDLGDELPRAIAVPKRGTDAPYYVGLGVASGAELDAALTLLDGQIIAIIRRRDALFNLAGEFRSKGGGDDDRLVDVPCPVLEPA